MFSKIFLLTIYFCFAFFTNASVTNEPPEEVNCFVDPCSVAGNCDAYPEAACVPNYIGGCNAEWFVDDRKVDCNNRVELQCDNMVNCFVAPCKFAKCEKHPEALCVDNYCGGCFANFYLNGRKIDCEAD